jgi:hypothetical protein
MPTGCMVILGVVEDINIPNNTNENLRTKKIQKFNNTFEYVVFAVWDETGKFTLTIYLHITVN